ncbi:unnamed protein product [[Actinomadura] parvosata subsp. kistnae]|uniref:DUF3037 domain-containing protein n=1 Tax=[Actinomadura] parvosata subsp. kistnae TaxID=1909395 RepID=A0A1U9ZQK6_9ACTN|nr:DUF3037 domain-containing protein [Nonomuraea sp. ATCC 55076]AQZ60226.1 hypothetical protein BKM31_00690 [Nonomuraea sp. ATCC 55076]SPL91292.1 unnamed protein product [Actinomadura parvosata subsp. kistnae]
MSRYIYSIVRCLPDPRTGEFVNIGAIAGDPTTGDWSLRQLSNLQRVRRFVDRPILETATGCLLKLYDEIERHQAALLEDTGEPLGEDWLERLHRDHRNIVQFSAPAPVIANDAQEALAFVFEHLIVDPVESPKHRSVTRHALQSQMRKAYQEAHLDERLVRAKVQLHVGAKLQSAMDFAIANGRVVQLTQTWSFRLAQVDEVPDRVKSWGYALGRFRDGEDARVVDALGNVSRIARDVDLEVVIAPPETPEETKAYEEAEQVFKNLGAEIHSSEDVAAISTKAAELAQSL